jgi:acyl dehydratase
MPYFDDARVGAIRELGSVHFSAEAIIAFARDYDPQYFHIDAEAAKKSQFGGLCASGWHTASACMRLVVVWFQSEIAADVARGESPGVVGPSPGFRDLKWPRPVFAGDTVTYRSELIDKRVSKSRPGWGITINRLSGVNQNGDAVLSFVSTGFLPRRPAGQ